MRVKLLDPRAKVPGRARQGDAGYDLSALEGVAVEPGRVTRVRTGIAVDFGCPCGNQACERGGRVGLICDRSGNASRGLHVVGGVVDSGYRGELVVLLANLGCELQDVRAGDRVAQLLVLRCLTPPVEVVDGLGETERGALGFGSSGR